MENTSPSPLSFDQQPARQQAVLPHVETQGEIPVTSAPEYGYEATQPTALEIALGELAAARARIVDLETANIRLEAEIITLRTITETDQLTADGNLRIGNRTALDRALPRAEADPDVTVISFDGNNFGKINKITEYGAQAGDMEIRAIVRAIRLACAEYGVTSRSIFRRGGDEFVALVPNRMVEYREYDAHAGVYTNTQEIPLADAVIRRADTLYGTRHFEGTYGDEAQPLSADVSITGSAGPTFADADAGLQAAKQLRKSQGSPR
jgi:GGDEF domain-containing protein